MLYAPNMAPRPGSRSGCNGDKKIVSSWDCTTNGWWTMNIQFVFAGTLLQERRRGRETAARGDGQPRKQLEGLCLVLWEITMSQWFY